MDPRWRRLRWLQVSRLVLLLGWLPFGMIVVFGLDRHGWSALALSVGGVYVMVVGATSWMFTRSTCPCCQWKFSTDQWIRWQSPFEPRCIHCDARIGDPITQSLTPRSGAIR